MHYVVSVFCYIFAIQPYKVSKVNRKTLLSGMSENQKAFYLTRILGNRLSLDFVLTSYFTVNLSYQNSAEKGSTVCIGEASVSVLTAFH